MDVDPEELFNKVSEKNLAILTERVGLPTRSKKKSKGLEKGKFVEKLVKNVIHEGTGRVLGVLKVKHLQELVDDPSFHLEEKWERPEPREVMTTPKKGQKEGKMVLKKAYPSKGMMTNFITTQLDQDGWKVFLEKYSQKILLMCCGDIDDLSGYEEDELNNFPKKELVKAILNNVYSFGLNHHFHLLSVPELKEFCVDMELDVESASKEVLIESIIEGKNFKKSVKKVVNPSSKKPAIKKGITKVDLKNWYNRDEIEKFLKEKKDNDETLKELKLSGKKNQLIERLLKILDGDIEGAVKKKKKRGRSKSRSGEEGSTEEKESKKRKTNN